MKQKSGFTLIEMIISMALLSVILVAVSAVFASALKNYQISFQKSGFQKDINFTVDDIDKNVKLAKSVEPSYDTYTLNETTLILGLPAIDNSGGFIYSGDALIKDYFIYYIQDGDLHKKIYADNLSSRQSLSGTDIVLLSYVDNTILDPLFLYLPGNVNPDQVKITMKLERTLYNSSVRVSSERLANLRNK